MRGIIAAGNAQTAEAAADALRAGGNAVDAAISAALACFVSEPLLASAGGAGMLTVALADQAPSTVDFFSAAPGMGGAPPAELDFVAVEVDFGSATQVFHIGRGSAAAPLALPGLAEAARRFGVLPLATIAAPAIAMAREGVTVPLEGSRVYSLLWPIVSRDPEAMAVMAPTGAPPEPGSVLKNAAMADTLEAFGRSGETPEIMRRGMLEAFGPERGGLLTEGDLAAPLVQVRSPLRVAFGDWEMITSPQVGGQLTAHIARRLLEGERAESEAARVVRFAEASVDAHDRRGALTAPGSTTHISVVDGAGGAASVTLTNGEGCGHLIPGTGIQLNNFLGEEDLNPHGFHLYEPGHRLPTMMAPTVALHRGKPVLALGSGGSNRIRSSVSQVLYRVARLGQTVAEAVRAPRVHAEGDTVWVEVDGLEDPDATVRALNKRFAQVFPFEERGFFFGGVHTVLRTSDGTLTAAGDPRRGGATAEVQKA